MVWDDDTGSPDDPVKIISIPNYDGKLIPFSLDNSVKKLTGNNGAFYVKVKAPELTAINDGMKFPKIRLLVNDAKEIYSAQLGSEDGKEKHMVVDYDEISYFYAHTRGIKTDENLYLEIRDSVVGRDPLLLIGKNIKVDESGVIKVKINWALIKNKVNFLTIYAIVKENNAEGEILYDADGNFSMATAKLMKSSSLFKDVGYKSAVMVEGTTIEKGKKEEKCPRCQTDITLSEFNRIFPDVDKLFYLGTNNLSNITIQSFLDSLNKTLKEFSINTCRKKAFFLSQIAKETGDFSRIDENLYYTTESALHNFWKKENNPKLYTNASDFFKNPENLGNYVYRNVAENGNESSGDGYKYRGRGLIQITRKKGYRRFGEYCGKDLKSNPDLLLNDLDLMVRSAGWYWLHGVLLSNGMEKDINEVAASGDFKETTRLIHGSTKDVKERETILNRVKPILKTDDCQATNRTNILSDADIEFHIFNNGGEIQYKIQNKKREIAAYYYHDKSNKVHELGKLKLKKVRNNYGEKYKDRINEDFVYLVDIRHLKNYNKDNIKFALKMNPGTNRFFMNDVSIASLIGAMLDCGYEDFVYNGFSDQEGRSIGGSESHKNGMNGDLRYLRKDISGKKLHLNIEAEKGDPCGWKGMDEFRQNTYNDALYKYGWKSMLSWRYDGKLLKHSKHYDDHYHHLHLQSFTPNLKLIK